MIPFVRTPDEMAQVVKQVDDYGLERNASVPRRISALDDGGGSFKRLAARRVH